jgi:hypothetical protein
MGAYCYSHAHTPDLTLCVVLCGEGDESIEEPTLSPANVKRFHMDARAC